MLWKMEGIMLEAIGFDMARTMVWGFASRVRLGRTSSWVDHFSTRVWSDYSSLDYVPGRVDRIRRCIDNLNLRLDTVIWIMNVCLVKVVRWIESDVRCS